MEVRICYAVIYTLTIGDSITCSCWRFGKVELSWILQKVNGEEIPLITNCSYPYKNCPVQYYEGNIFFEVNNFWNKLTVQHVEQDMFRLICTPNFTSIYLDNCMMNVVDSAGAPSVGSPIHTLNKGDQFTCDCDLFGSPKLEWTLQKVSGEMISLVRTCYQPYTSCIPVYDPANFITVTEDKNAYMKKYSSIAPMFVSKLTVKHVDKDMLRVFCSSDGFGNRRDRCLMNVVDYVRPNNGTSKSTATYSTTQSPGVYLTKYPTQSFLTTPFEFLFLTTPKPATENYATSHEQNISLYALIFVAVLITIICVIASFYIIYAKIKKLQIEREAMRAVSRTPQLTPTTAPEPYQNDMSSTRVNPLVHPSNSTLTTESQQHTASIQNSAPNDLPPPYSSLLELRVEPPPYTTLTAESYNCESAPSHEAQDVPPPYTTRYIATYNSVSLSAQQQAQNVPPPYTRYTTTYNCVALSAQQATNEPPPPYTVWHTS
ncbi:uncharacterized protein LOC131934796 isoform X2 [Physella acuta]|uniref:uncharacterized protein LOC131934796 isoform X2 n=1 Tax=Physella acuta TaxID=109671 RepID=UPI0027DD300D|nr:uncharacterized protein LOC131934796 isoform X2 [Physella acuta]